MPHPPPRGGSPAGNKRNNGLGHSAGLIVLLQKLRGLLLAGAANLADEDDAVRVGVVEEDPERLSVCGAREGVAADADHERLPEAHRGRLCDGFVCERAGARDDPCVGLLDRSGAEEDRSRVGERVGSEKMAPCWRVSSARDRRSPCRESTANRVRKLGGPSHIILKVQKHEKIDASDRSSRGLDEGMTSDFDQHVLLRAQDAIKNRTIKTVNGSLLDCHQYRSERSGGVLEAAGDTWRTRALGRGHGLRKRTLVLYNLFEGS